MTRQRDKFTEGAYQDLLDAVQAGDESAARALQTLQQLRAKNEPYAIKHDPHHGWRVYDKLEETRPIEETQPMRRPRGE